jgi:hypothetical protein
MRIDLDATPIRTPVAGAAAARFTIHRTDP